jgi:hypothetical protein
MRIDPVGSGRHTDDAAGTLADGRTDEGGDLRHVWMV